MDEQKDLNVRELLKNTYSVLCQRHGPQEIVFQKRALSEIADDSDYPGDSSRKGYMFYEGIGLFQLESRTWAIARGERSQNYPAQEYDSDILALGFSAEGKTQEQIQEELGNDINNSSYFENSLIYGVANGNLVVKKGGRFKERMKSELNRSNLN